MAELFAAAVSIAATRRRRFFWAAWWTAPPERKPFLKPDAAQGGARTREEARRAAEKAAGRPLVELDGAWARAWARILVGEDAWPAAGSRDGGATSARRAPAPAEVSIWHILGLAPGAGLEEIKRAYRQRALMTHPDHGGDSDAFRELKRAYDAAMKRSRRRRPRR